MAESCVFCDREFPRSSPDVYLENAHCVYASTRDPRDPPESRRAAGSLSRSIIAPLRSTSRPEKWAATRELLLAAKEAWDERLAPDGYTLIWNCGPAGGQETPHAHLHVIPRFDDEPRAGAGGRFAIKVPENRRPDPLAPGNGRARSLGAAG